MIYTILIPLSVTILACTWAMRNFPSNDLIGPIGFLLYGAVALILSLGTWLAWALIMWGYS